MPFDRLSASPNRIDIWVARPADCGDPVLVADYRKLLAPDEAKRMQRLVRKEDRHRFLVTRALTRTVLARYLAMHPAELVFGTNAYGRPFLENDANSASLSFNITHTHDCVVLGVTQRRTLGIDIESKGRKAATIGVANRFFSEPECTSLNALPTEEQQQRFFAYWTLKESYIKARGMGLAIPLGKFGFDFLSPYEFELFVDKSLGDDPQKWQFWQLEIDEHFLVSVCASARVSALPQLNVQASIPLHHEEVLPFRQVAASHGWPDQAGSS